jgi:leader peptidase (prepilin peptidase)/N-methyltransferase
MVLILPLIVGLTTDVLLSLRQAQGGAQRCASQRRAALPAALIAFAINLVSLLWFSPTPAWLLLNLAAGVLVVAATVDAACRVIPNIVIVVGLIGGLLLAPLGVGLKQAALGAVLAFGTFLTLYLLRPGALGMGDVKLAAFIGLVVGLDGVPVALGSAVLAGGLYGLVLLASGRANLKDAVAYGPALSLGGLIGLWYVASLHR